MKFISISVVQKLHCTECKFEISPINVVSK